MSPSTPRQPSAQDAARAEPPSTPAAARPLPAFQPHIPSPYSPIEREIERSERASAALAATRALARASFTDSQLAAEDAAARDGLDDEFDASGWARTEHVAFDPTPQGDGHPEPAPRSLVGGTFNPGIASQQGRLFPGASIAQAPIRTRSGATARFAQESRHAPRGEAAAPRPAAASPSAMHYEKPAVIPMLALPKTAVSAKARAPARSRSRTSEPAKLLLAAALGAAMVLAGGGLAWNAGLLSRGPGDEALVTPAVAAQAEAARLLSQERDIAIAPAAGLPSQRSDEEVDAALAAAARAAAVPADSVRAAAPASASAATPVRASMPRRAAPRPQAVDEAIANARARADRFLAPPSAVKPDAPAPATPVQ